MDKLMETIVELRTKGSLQEQAEKLYDDEKLYKKLIAEYNKQLQEIDSIDNELLRESFLMRNKYKVRLENVKDEMCYLNKRIIDTLEVIEPFVDTEILCEKFEVDYDTYDNEDDFYGNLLVSNSKIAHVCRTGLIQNEKIVKEMMEEDKEEDKEDDLASRFFKYYGNLFLNLANKED